MTVNEVAQNVQKKMAGELKSIDPFTILLIAGLIVNIVRAAQECWKIRHPDPEPIDVVSIIKKPTRAEKFRLRQMIREKVGRRKGVSSLFNNLLSTGQELSDDEIKAVASEAENMVI